MTKKSILFLSILTLTAVAVTGGVLWYSNTTQEQIEVAQKDVEEAKKQEMELQKKMEETKQEKKFIVDVDMNVENWQTKETEFFTIKFPKEWYWMESRHSGNEGYSKVITNNPNFDIDRYADIGVGAGIGYPLVLKNDTEVVMTFSGVAGTIEFETPVESIDWQIEGVKTYINHDAVCDQNNVDTPYPAAFCSFVNKENQNFQIYFVAEKSLTYAFTARTTKENGAEIRPILERIAKNFVVNYGASKE